MPAILTSHNAQAARTPLRLGAVLLAGMARSYSVLYGLTHSPVGAGHACDLDFTQCAGRQNAAKAWRCASRGHGPLIQVVEEAIFL